jgi:putative transposase
MTRSENKPSIAAVKDLMGANHDALREIVQDLLQEMLEGEMTEALGASKSERSDGRVGYRSGHYNRTLITRVGKLELRVPQDRDGRFSTELFERYQRSEQALVATLAEMYVQGVSTRKVKIITEELCGHSFSASTISSINKRLDESLTAFARRRLDEPFAYLIIDAKYEKVRQAGVVRSCAVLVALGVDWEGRRQILAVELANRESRSSWKDFLVGLRDRGLHGVEYVVADDHAGLRAAVREVFPDAWFQLLRAFLAQCARPSTAQSRRRLSAGAPLDLRPARTLRGEKRSGGMAEEMVAEIPQAHRLGGGDHRGDLHLLQAPAAAP